MYTRNTLVTVHWLNFNFLNIFFGGFEKTMFSTFYYLFRKLDCWFDGNRGEEKVNKCSDLWTRRIFSRAYICTYDDNNRHNDRGANNIYPSYVVML